MYIYFNDKNYSNYSILLQNSISCVVEEVEKD